LFHFETALGPPLQRDTKRDMADFIYNAEGRAQGFRLGSNIYALDGTPVGRVWAERAYRFDGSYVGALFKNMVVDKPSVSKRNLPSLPRPGRGRAGNQRGDAPPHDPGVPRRVPPAPGPLGRGV
jgi:hypothetical protein